MKNKFETPIQPPHEYAKENMLWFLRNKVDFIGQSEGDLIKEAVEMTKKHVRGMVRTKGQNRKYYKQVLLELNNIN